MAVIARAEVTLTRIEVDEETHWHFWHDEEGAHVTEVERPADGEAITGKNVLLTGDGLQIRNGSTVLASFEDDSISLADGDGSADIYLCGRAARFRGNVGGYLELLGGAGMDVEGRLSADTIISQGTLSVGAPMYLGVGRRTGIRCFVQGTVVVTVSGTTATLFSSAQYQAIVGRPYKSGDCVLVCNGDRNANSLGPIASVNPSSGAWYVNVPTAASGSASYRVNYLIVAVY